MNRRDAIKKLAGVPEGLQSCHTAMVEGYVLEGHVPAKDIEHYLFKTGYADVIRTAAGRRGTRAAGKIINMCSMMSELGRDTVGAYASAKGGLKLLTANMCCEWAKYNVQINGIGPGYIKTDATGPIAEPGNPIHDFIIDRTPTGRWGKPEDLQGAALFLLSLFFSKR